MSPASRPRFLWLPYLEIVGGLIVVLFGAAFALSLHQMMSNRVLIREEAWFMLWPASLVVIGACMVLDGQRALLVRAQQRMVGRLAAMLANPAAGDAHQTPGVWAGLTGRAGYSLVFLAGLTLLALAVLDPRSGDWPFTNVLGQLGLDSGLSCVGGRLALFVLSGSLALAGHRGLLYQSNNRIAARLADLIRQHPPRPPEPTP